MWWAFRSTGEWEMFITWHLSCRHVFTSIKRSNHWSVCCFYWLKILSILQFLRFQVQMFLYLISRSQNTLALNHQWRCLHYLTSVISGSLVAGFIGQVSISRFGGARVPPVQVPLAPPIVTLGSTGFSGSHFVFSLGTDSPTCWQKIYRKFCLCETAAIPAWATEPVMAALIQCNLSFFHISSSPFQNTFFTSIHSLQNPL